MATRPRPEPGTIKIEICEVWMREWVEYGFTEMNTYLQRHALFDQYLQQKGSRVQQDQQ